MEKFWYAFIPLFVAFDVVGLLPVYWALAARLSTSQRNSAVRAAALTALLVAVGFLIISRSIFSLMGIELADLMIAGGAILIVLSLRDLLFPDEPPKGSYPSPGVVPLGVPLLAGPAVLTAVVLVRDRYGWSVTSLALLTNIVLIWVVLRSSESLMRILGKEGSQVISKIASLVLTAFGVMLIRHGILAIIGASFKG